MTISQTRKPAMLECVVNVSEGKDELLLKWLADGAGGALLDLHRSSEHNRSVLTLAGEDTAVMHAAREVTSRAVDALDIGTHRGAHPRLGVVDVVPFIPLAWDQGRPGRLSCLRPDLSQAIRARDSFASWAWQSLGVPCFTYGPERSLPEIRRQAFRALHPDAGGIRSHPSAGAICVGARPMLVAYNCWVRGTGLSSAREMAAALRGPDLRALAFALPSGIQISCNLLNPCSFAPSELYDKISTKTSISRTELVGLIPGTVLDRIDPTRWKELDLSDDRTIEQRLNTSGKRSR